MATLAQLEDGLKRAYESGNMEYARILAVEVKKARADRVNQIPGQGEQDAEIPGTNQKNEDPPTMADKALGVLDAGATTLSAMTTGAIGRMAGTAYGMGQVFVNDKTGDEAKQIVDNAANAAGGALTWRPRTEEGRDYVQTVGEVAQAIPPVLPAAPAMASAAPGVTNAAKVASRKIPEAVKTASQNIKAAMPAADDAFGGGSIGAAEVAKGTLRQAKANELPVQMKLTKGIATGDFAQLQFEREIAKHPELGAPVRERMSQYQKQMMQNLDTFVDSTGAEFTNTRDVGIKVHDSLRQMVAQAKNKERVLYREAKMAGEMEAPVSTEPLVRFLQENSSFNSDHLSGATLGFLEKELVRLGGATRVDGRLVPKTLTLEESELVRRGVNAAINAKRDNPTNMATGVAAKEVIDAMTDGAGGRLYKTARNARAQRARDFENVALVSNILGTKRGSTDRAIALEDIVKKSIMTDSTSLDQTRHLGKLLKKTPQGQQAWKELQGATLREIRDAAFGGVTTDSAGNKVISAAKLNNAITKLDKNGKLDYMFGKKGAEQLRTVNEVSQFVFTTPPGVVNTSNTASALITAIDSTLTYLTTGVPAPAVATIKEARQRLKDRQTRKLVEEALK